MFSWTFAREDKLVERAKTLKVQPGTEPDTDLGPVISKQVQDDSESNQLLIPTLSWDVELEVNSLIMLTEGNNLLFFFGCMYNLLVKQHIFLPVLLNYEIT